MLDITFVDPTCEFMDCFRVRGEEKFLIRVDKSGSYGVPIARGTYKTVKPVLETFLMKLAHTNTAFKEEELSDLCTQKHIEGEIILTPVGKTGRAFLEHVIMYLQGYNLELTEASSHVPTY